MFVDLSELCGLKTGVICRSLPPENQSLISHTQNLYIAFFCAFFFDLQKSFRKQIMIPAPGDYVPGAIQSRLLIPAEVF